MLEHNRTNPVITIVFILGSLACLIPFWLILMVSLSGQNALAKYGYSFWPREFDLVAYRFLIHDAEPILRSFGVSILVTVIGTAVSLLVTSALAFSLSRQDFPYRGAVSLFVLITMLFGGGLLPWYLVYTKFLHLQNTLFALIVPGLLGAFNVFIIRTYFTTSIPPSLIDSAQIDGASEYRTYFNIIIPLSLPVLATIGLFTIVGYWNDWFTSLVFINTDKLYNLQYFLYNTLMNAQYLQSVADKAHIDAASLQVQPLEELRMAMAIIAVLPVALVFPFLQKYFVKGLTIGAVKG
ncbi:carbohydrate ABC transporter permease [Paenibacillus sacheonensis]|uniref:ABC transporter permease subunit n=1 Tax=Paenibacillus sacheonensis TaxID=742054 RepID=A0A7X4YVR2_9BACL|nr:carbohydrate ABC transporter permease [Paenibacillus sacheonensis]MBM7568650.1 putative aldouronate transport system permease protein [Paenibacillus sacheonensis]NBC72459.1 ABC transporter permease subunit [Paenibacillus sacheonensis]